MEATTKLLPIKFPQHFLVGLAIIVLGLNLFAFRVRVGIGDGLFLLTVLVTVLFVSARLRKKRLAYILVLVGSVSALALGLRANGFVQSFNLIVSLVALMGLVLLRAFPRLIWRGLSLLRAKWQFFSTTLFAFPALLKTSAADEGKPNIAKILKTVLLTFVVVAIFMGLLSEADPIFAELIEDFRQQAIARTFFSLLLAVAVTSLLAVRFEKSVEDHSTLKFLSFHDLLVVLMAVDLLFGFFLFVQAKYLFLGNNVEDLVRFGLTYSEYVRKGFVELLIVGVLGGLLSYVALLKQRMLEKSSRVVRLRLVNAVLIVELGLVLVSALKRDLLYVDIYGLTRTRIIGGMFLIWLAGLLVMLFFLVSFRKLREQYLFAVMGVLSVAVVVFLNLFNVDGYIARAKRPDNRPRDFFYINILSEDAVSGWADSVPYALGVYNQFSQKPSLTADEKTQLAEAKLAMISLQIKHDELMKKYADFNTVEGKFYDGRWEDQSDWIRETLKRQRKWQSYNLSEYRAYQAMLGNSELFEETINCIVDETLVYQKHYGINLVNEEAQRLYEFSYPFVNLEIRRWYTPIDVEMAVQAAQYQGRFPAVKPPELAPPGSTRLASSYTPTYDQISARAPQKCSPAS